MFGIQHQCSQLVYWQQAAGAAEAVGGEGRALASWAVWLPLKRCRMAFDSHSCFDSPELSERRQPDLCLPRAAWVSCHAHRAIMRIMVS